mgnify:CR=1 FL=1
MNKEEFLAQLRGGLGALPLTDTEERIAFYDEMINDRMEEGLSEEEAVIAVGTVDEIVKGALSDTSLSKLVREKVKPRRALRPWEIVLLAAGSPLWLALLIAAAAIVFSIYIALWAVIVTLCCPLPQRFFAGLCSALYSFCAAARPQRSGCLAAACFAAVFRFFFSSAAWLQQREFCI